jgi:hypothetical protein
LRRGIRGINLPVMTIIETTQTASHEVMPLAEEDGRACNGRYPETTVVWNACARVFALLRSSPHIFSQRDYFFINIAADIPVRSATIRLMEAAKMKKNSSSSILIFPPR